MKLNKLILNNIGIHKLLKVEFGEFTTISGSNAEGKTTIENAIIESIEGSDALLLSNDEETGSIEVLYDNEMSVKIPYRKGGKGSPEIRQGRIKVSKPRTQLEEWHNDAKIRAIDFFDGKGAGRKKYQTNTVLSILSVSLGEDEIQSLTGGELPLDDFFAVDHPLTYIKRLVNEKDGYYYRMRAKNNEGAQTVTHSNNTLYKKISDKLNDANIDPVFFNPDEYKDKSVTSMITELNNRHTQNSKLGTEQEIIDNYETEIQNLNDLESIEIDKKNKEFNNDWESNRKDMQERLASIPIEIKNFEQQIELLNEKIKGLKDKSKELSKTLSEEQETQNAKALQFITPVKEKYAEKRDALKKDVLLAEKFISENLIVDTADFASQIDAVQAVKEVLPTYDAWLEGAKEYEKMKDRSVRLSEIIDGLRGLPSKILKREKLPIENLTMNNDGNFMIVNSRNMTVALDQLSGFEKIKLSIDISVARLGKIRVLILPQWAEIDPANKVKIKKYLKEKDVQGVAIEVGTGNLKIERD